MSEVGRDSGSLCCQCVSFMNTSRCDALLILHSETGCTNHTGRALTLMNTKHITAFISGRNIKSVGWILITARTHTHTQMHILQSICEHTQSSLRRLIRPFSLLVCLAMQISQHKETWRHQNMTCLKMIITVFIPPQPPRKQRSGVQWKHFLLMCILNDWINCIISSPNLQIDFTAPLPPVFPESTPSKPVSFLSLYILFNFWGIYLEPWSDKTKK